ncbi:MAG: GumC family protein, partial [Ramlibacter sp.]
MPLHPRFLLRDAARSLSFHRGLVLATVAGFAVLAAIAITLVPRHYTSTATVMVLGGDDLPNTVGGSQLATTTLAREAVLSAEAAILRSPATMHEVVRQLGDRAEVGLHPPWARYFGFLQGPSDTGAAADDRTVKVLLDNLRVTPDKAGGTIELAFSGQDRAMTAVVLNELIAAYQERRKLLYGRVRSPSIAAASDAAKTQLERLDAELASFQTESGLINFGTQMDLALRNRQEVARMLQAARTEELETKRRVENLRAQLKVTPREVVQYSDMESDRRIQAFRDSLADLRKQEAQLRQTYTDDSEKVRAVRQQIRLLEQEASRTSALSAPSGVRRGINEVRTSIELALMKADSEVQALRERTQELGKQAAASEAEFRSLQDKRSRYDALVRQKTVAEQQYLAVQRAYNERMANEEIAQLGQPGARVIQPAEAPLRPARTREAIVFAAAMLCLAAV